MNNNYCDISASCEIVNKLKTENEELNKIIERLDVPKHEVIDMDIALENEKLKTELQRYKDMETKGLEEFKDVGGCWGCGIQLSLDQMTKDYIELKAELEPFKDEYFKGLDNVTIAELAKKSIRITAENCKLEQTLTDIKEIAIGIMDDDLEESSAYYDAKRILQKCEVLDVEND